MAWATLLRRNSLVGTDMAKNKEQKNMSLDEFIEYVKDKNDSKALDL